MKEKKQDMRYKRTQRNLKAALIELLKEKNINKISVRELSERSDINRATFYLHYDSPYDLLASLETELFDKVFSSYKNNALNNPDDFFLTLYKCIYENYELSKILFNQNTGYNFWGKLSNELQSYYINNLRRKHFPYDKKELEYYCTFVKDGYLSIVKHWILNGMQESPEYMVEISRKFLLRVLINDMLGRKSQQIE